MSVMSILLLGLTLRLAEIEMFAIQSASMLPGLSPGDAVIAYRLPYVTGAGRLPGRGDLVVFRLPQDPNEVMLKRVIGVPGDVVALIGGRVHINGERLERWRIVDHETEDREGGLVRLPQYVEILPGGLRNRIIEMRDDGMLDDTEAVEVPEGHYFVLGDHRDMSLDSRERFRIGMVPLDSIVAHPIWIIEGP